MLRNLFAGESRVRGMQRTALVLLVAAGTLNYFDRSALAVANPLIRQDLGLTIEQMGLLLSAFLWAYALSQFPGSLLIDRFRAKRLLGGALAVWSVAQSLAGLSANLLQFAAARAVLGVGESPMYPSATWVTRAWFAPSQRSLVTGIWNSSSTLGPTLAPPILTFVMLSLGWRAMFVSLGVIGLAVAALWLLLYRDPERLRLRVEEHTHHETQIRNTTTAPSLADWRRLFHVRATWALVFGFFGIIYLLWLFSTWLPGYLEIQHHMAVRTTAWVAAIPFAFGAIGNLSSGWIADGLLRSGHPAITVRKRIILVAILLMACATFGAAYSNTAPWAIACISLALLCNGASTTMMWCLVSDVAPVNLTASLGGITNFGGYVGGALAPLATGVLVQRTGNFILPMLLATAIALLCAVAFYWLLRGSIAFEIPPPLQLQSER